MHSLTFPESGWIAPCSFSRTGNFPFPPADHRTETSAGMHGEPLRELHGCCGCRALEDEQENSRKVVPFPPCFYFPFYLYSQFHSSGPNGD